LLVHKAGRLAFFGAHTHLNHPRAFKAYLAPLRKIEWVIHAKGLFGGPQAALVYLSRYAHRVAISNHRLIAADQTGITFIWKDYRIDGPGRYTTMTMPTHELIRASSCTCSPAASSSKSLLALHRAFAGHFEASNDLCRSGHSQMKAPAASAARAGLQRPRSPGGTPSA
jgi:Putative transposase